MASVRLLAALVAQPAERERESVGLSLRVFSFSFASFCLGTVSCSQISSCKYIYTHTHIYTYTCVCFPRRVLKYVYFNNKRAPFCDRAWRKRCSTEQVFRKFYCFHFLWKRGHLTFSSFTEAVRRKYTAFKCPPPPFQKRNNVFMLNIDSLTNNACGAKMADNGAARTRHIVSVRHVSNGLVTLQRGRFICCSRVS